MGVMGNKGGVGIRFRLRGSSLCFVSCHLAAHRENIKARNENYQKVKRLTTTNHNINHCAFGFHDPFVCAMYVTATSLYSLFRFRSI